MNNAGTALNSVGRTRLDGLQQIRNIPRIGDERHRRAADNRVTLHADAGVHMEQRQRDEGDILRRVRWRMQPRRELQAGCDQAPMQSNYRLWHAGRAAAHQHDGGIVGGGGGRRD